MDKKLGATVLELPQTPLLPVVSYKSHKGTLCVVQKFVMFQYLTVTRNHPLPNSCIRPQ